MPKVPKSILIVSIIEILKKLNGKASDKELYEELRKVYDIQFSQFLQILMTMEIQGMISVNMPKDDLRIVELV
ncbi:MAG: hypothetical protein DRO15_06300 [Thermoprotei archaeon]|nr:MAG: hypothetical protein DRO15_06300 [Thermoprotei archaeon]